MKGHKWFAAFYDFLMAGAESTFMRRVRHEVVGQARGRVLEVGCGTGASFPYYQDPAAVVATEPDPYMLARAKRRARALGLPITLLQARAEDLPFPTGYFDTVVATFVFCSVEDVGRALMEVRRVLRPGGELRFFEHVRYHHRLGAWAQDAITPLWRWLAAGCHPNRDTPRLMEKAGFRLVRLEILTPVPPLPPTVFIRPQALGVARPV
jgi:ubiquinone/menaquinone biosynthesis C-methylase UbiE